MSKNLLKRLIHLVEDRLNSARDGLEWKHWQQEHAWLIKQLIALEKK